MKSTIAFLLTCAVLAGLIAFAIAGDDYTTTASGTTTISKKVPHGTRSILVVPHSEDVIVRLHRNSVSQERFTMPYLRVFPITELCDSIHVLRATATAVTIVFDKRGNVLPSVSVGGDLSIADLETVTILQNYTLPAAAYETFPVPLISMGNHNYLAFSVSATTCGDTLWYQVVQGNTLMDTTTVFNFGSSGSRETLRYLIWDSDSTSFATDALYDTGCLYLDTLNSAWKPDGIFFETVGYNVMIQNASGYSSHAKFAGIRVGSSAATGITGLKIIAHLGTIGGVEGD